MCYAATRGSVGNAIAAGGWRSITSYPYTAGAKSTISQIYRHYAAIVILRNHPKNRPPAWVKARPESSAKKSLSRCIVICYDSHVDQILTDLPQMLAAGYGIGARGLLKSHKGIETIKRSRPGSCDCVLTKTNAHAGIETIKRLTRTLFMICSVDNIESPRGD